MMRTCAPGATNLWRQQRKSGVEAIYIQSHFDALGDSKDAVIFRSWPSSTTCSACMKEKHLLNDVKYVAVHSLINLLRAQKFAPLRRRTG